MLSHDTDFLFTESIDSLPLLKKSALDYLNKKDRIVEMSYFDLSFLSGLIKKHRPKKILEIGTAAGGTAALILKTLFDCNIEAEFSSVDIRKTCINSNKEIGYIVFEMLPELAGNWHLYSGKIIPEVIEEITGPSGGGRFLRF